MHRFPPPDLHTPTEVLQATGNVARVPIVQIVSGQYVLVVDVQEDQGTASVVVVHGGGANYPDGTAGYIALAEITDACVTRH